MARPSLEITSGTGLDATIRVLQIIVLALASGVFLFAAFVVFQGALAKPPGPLVISSLGAILAAGALGLQAAVPRLWSARADGSGDSDACHLQRLQMQTIMSAALLEGAAFANLVALLLEHHAWSLAVSGVLWIGLLAKFPTRTRAQQWLETKRMEADIDAQRV